MVGNTELRVTAGRPANGAPGGSRHGRRQALPTSLPARDSVSRGNQARLWDDVRCDELDDGCLDNVLAVLRSHAASCEEAAQCAEYIAHNRERMRYADFRTRGLCFASGVVESSCKTALATRLKRPGTHWTVDAANAIAALRCCILSGLYEDLCGLPHCPRMMHVALPWALDGSETQ